MTRTRPTHLLLAAASLLALAAGPAAAGDPVADLKSEDVHLRLAAVESLRTGSADAEAALLTALQDADWEVVEKAVTALGEKGRTPAASKALAKVAVDHPSRRLRIVAARAVARLDAWSEVAEDFGKVRPDDLSRVLDSVAAVAETREGEVLTKLVERGLAARKDQAAQIAAARAIGAYAPAARAEKLRELVAHPDAAVAAAAIDGSRAKPDDACVPVLLDVLERPKAPETVQRRARVALVEVVGRKAKGDEAAKAAQPMFDALKGASAAFGWHLARLVGEIGELPDEHVPRDVLVGALAPVFSDGAPKVRASAAWSLGRIGGDAAADRVADLAATDADAHVRLIALQSLARLRPATHDGAFSVFAKRLEDDDVLVREAAAVALGRRGVAGALPSLRKAADRALDDAKGAEWTVGCAALVSIGKTRAPDGVPYLQDVAARAKDWKLRGAALVGLGHSQDPRALPTLIDALASKEPAHKTVAYEFLRRAHPDEKFGAKSAEWAAWWKKAGGDFRFVDREEELRKAQKYGYAPDLTGVYEGLDVVVFQSRGDKIEALLTQLKIDHRLTRSGSVREAGLHPLGIFVSNCTGEITNKDVEPIAWFVRSGGALFGSCWSLSKTIQVVLPGCIEKSDNKQEILADVIAEPCNPRSPFVEGVFQPHVRPMYILEGAHLIHVLDPERAEVLMDSPWTEQKYGNGNLVAWFPMGHGVVLDSANHFELQGYAHAKTETRDEMVAHALDHLGLTYAEIRKIPAAAWKSKQDAGKEAKDLSCFRFLTNFVREKRKSQE